MKLINVIFLLLVSATSLAQLNDFPFFSEEKEKPTEPISAWYWDPDKSGMGMSVTVQKSLHVESGYLVFAAFYTYKEDGSQAWYTVQGDYVPNPDVNAWKETPDYLPAGSESHLGHIDSRLAETSGGIPIDGEYRPNEVFFYKPIKMVWRNPTKIEIFIDGATVPDHVFDLFTWYGDPIKGDADFLTESFWQFTGIKYSYNSASTVTPVTFSRYNSVISFEKFVPEELFTDGQDYMFQRFNNVVERKDGQVFYVSSRPIGITVGGLETNGDLSFYDRVGIDDSYLVLVYDKNTKLIDGFYMATATGTEDLSEGLSVFMGDFKFRGHLPSSEIGRMSLYPADCQFCGDRSSMEPEILRRSAWHFFELPDTGDSLTRLPDVFVDGGFIND